MRLTHEAQVIPSTGNDTISMGVAVGVVMVAPWILLGSILAQRSSRDRLGGYSMRIVAVNIPIPHMYSSVPGSMAGRSITLSPGSRIFSMPRSGTTR